MMFSGSSIQLITSRRIGKQNKRLSSATEMRRWGSRRDFKLVSCRGELSKFAGTRFLLARKVENSFWKDFFSTIKAIFGQITAQWKVNRLELPMPKLANSNKALMLTHHATQILIPIQAWKVLLVTAMERSRRQIDAWLEVVVEVLVVADRVVFLRCVHDLR